MDQDLERNQATAKKLIVVPVALMAALATVVGILAGLVGGVPLLSVVSVVLGIAMFFAGVMAFRNAAFAPLVAATRSHPVTEADEPRLHNLVEGLCVGVGLELPRLRIVEDPAPNALAIARAVDDAELVVTRGLIDTLSLVELEAVLAHELARIRRGEAIVGAVAGVVLPNVLFGAIARMVVATGEPIDTWSDLAAVEITRYPPALAAALAKMDASGAALPTASGPAVAHLWVHGARAEGAFGPALARVYEIPPPVGQRIEVLEEL